jgi:POT family proton-dependent oligopeptide transporter
MVFVLVEMWERFCFYGMRGGTILWQIRFRVALSDRDANLKYGAIQAFCLCTFIGGIFADKVLGFKKSLLLVLAS